MKLEALFDAIIVKPIEEEETMYGSIVVPDAGKDRNEKGEVIAVGPGCEYAGVGLLLFYLQWDFQNLNIKEKNIILEEKKKS
jgi:co-chaperonin GroES (HSP10)